MSSAFAALPPIVEDRTTAGGAPPLPRYEPTPPARLDDPPQSGWAWRDGRYQWIEGRRLQNPPGPYYHPDRWDYRDGRWQRTPGGWSATPQLQPNQEAGRVPQGLGGNGRDGLPNRFEKR